MKTVGWFWHQAPIETQALLIEALAKSRRKICIAAKTVDDLKTWLLKNKQTNNWKTTKATAEACYALLLQGTDLVINEPVVEIKLGNSLILTSSERGATEQEAGTGYFKKTIDGNKIDPTMGNISVKIQSSKVPTSGGFRGLGRCLLAIF